MTAGSGIMHEEKLPAAERLLGVQLWLNLPAKAKMAPPAYHSIKNADIEEIEFNWGKLRLLAGEFEGSKGYMSSYLPLDYYDLHLNPKESVILHTAGEFGVKLPLNTKIVVNGDNTISTVDIPGSGTTALYCNGNLEITSDTRGSLNVTSCVDASIISRAIYCVNSVIISGNVELNATSDNANSNGSSYVISSDKSVTIKDYAAVNVSVNKASFEAIGIRTPPILHNDINIGDNAIVAAMISSGAQYAYSIFAGKNLNISNNASVTAITGRATYSYGIYTRNEIISDGTVIAVSLGSVKDSSYGIYCYSDNINISGGCGVAMGKTSATNSEPIGSYTGSWDTANGAISWGGAAIPVMEVTLSESSISLLKNASVTLAATANYPTNATNQQLSWSSSNPSVATVTSSGNGTSCEVTGVSAGTATIAAVTPLGTTFSCAVTVTMPALDHIEITSPPDKTDYIEGDYFSSTGMVVTATYENGDTAEVTSYTIYPDGPLSTDDEFVTVSYTEGEITVTDKVGITVSEKTYTLTVSLNGGNGNTPGGSYAEGTNISINAGVKEGYTFSGWTSNNGGAFANPGSAATTFTMPANDVTVTANWTANSSGGWTPDPEPTPAPTPPEDTFIFTPSIIDEMIAGQQRINIDNGLQILADLKSIPRDNEDSIIIKISEIRDADALNGFYQSYPTLQALFKGYEVSFTIERNNQSTPINEFIYDITLRFHLTPEELQGLDPNTLVVYKEAEDGAITKLYGTFDWATLTYTVTTKHLCNFYLMAEAASNEPWANPFSDVKDTDWFYSAVEFVNRHGFYVGTGANTFSPDGAMTRAMFWTVLGRMNGQKLSGDGVYDAARIWAMGAGVTDGTNPDVNITREQMVTILWRYVGSPAASGDLSRFPDAGSVSDYAVNAMTWAVENGIILGDNGALMPQDNATRAQAAAILQRLIEAAAKQAI